MENIVSIPINESSFVPSRFEAPPAPGRGASSAGTREAALATADEREGQNLQAANRHGKNP
jgi:hypothetical protein